MAEDCDDVAPLRDSCDIVTLDDFREAEEESLIDNSYLTPVFIELDSVNEMGGSQNGVEHVEKENVPSHSDTDRVNTDTNIDSCREINIMNVNPEDLPNYDQDRNENAGYVFHFPCLLTLLWLSWSFSIKLLNTQADK